MPASAHRDLPHVPRFMAQPALNLIPAIPLLLTLAAVSGSLALADDDDPAPQRQAAVPRSPGTVRLTAAQHELAGIETQALAAATQRPEIVSYGKVVDIQPLLDLRARLRAAQADIEVAAAALGLAEKNRNRVKSLYQADILPGRDLAQAEAQWQADRVRAEAARRHVEEIRREAQNVWGSDLVALTLDGPSALLDHLASHHRSLVQIVLPAGINVAPGAVLRIGRDFDRDRGVQAEWVSPAPRTDELTQGETWYYQAPGEHLRTGMRVNVWLPGGAERRGVTVPTSAIVWHAGQPWVYRETRDHGFVRVAVPAMPGAGSSLFVDSVLTPGQRVVIRGAQTLLSEEFRQQIPDEDDAAGDR